MIETGSIHGGRSLAVAEPRLTPRAIAALGRVDGGDPVTRFEQLTGMPLDRFEQLTGMPLDRFEPAWRRRITTVRRHLQ